MRCIGHDLLRRSCRSFSDICALHTHSLATTCLTANPPPWPWSFFYKRFDTPTAMVMQKPNGFNSNRRSQNINKICFSPQVLLPALGWGTCHLLPHFHTRHVPRARLADGARAASFTIFFGHDLPRRSCSRCLSQQANRTHSMSLLNWSCCILL